MKSIKTLVLGLLFVFGTSYAADVNTQRTVLTSSITTVTTTSSYTFPRAVAARTYQATVVGTGAVTATVLIQGSNDESQWVTLGTITLSGTTSSTDGFTSSAPWPFVRGNVTAVSGTSATVTITSGI